MNERIGIRDDDFSITGLTIMAAFLERSFPLPQQTDKMNTLRNVKDFVYNKTPLNQYSYADTMSRISLFIVETYLQRSHLDERDREEILSILEDISKNEKVSNQNRSRASYVRGHDYLLKARKAGELQTLWMEDKISNLSSKDSFDESLATSHLPNLEEAKRCFHQAVGYAGPPSTILSRESMRCLALTSGPCHFTGELIHSSIGSTSRQKVSLYQSNQDESDCFDHIDSVFSAFDENINCAVRNEELNNMYKAGAKIVPSSWNFIAMCLCPTGELLVSRLFLDEVMSGDTSFKYDTTCIFPNIPTNYHGCSVVMEDFLKPFEDLMERSKSQLSGIDGNVAETFNADTAAKIDWWNEREILDRELANLLDSFQQKYFDNQIMRERIFNFHNAHDQDDSSSALNLASRFEAACNINEKEASNAIISETVESLQKLTVKQLKQWLEEFNVEGKTMRSLRKAGLVDLLLRKLEDESRLKVENEREDLPTNQAEGQTNSTGQGDSKNVTFLILDEHLCRFPFEGLPMLKGKTVCRLPSFPFAVSILHRRIQPTQTQVNAVPSKTHFILDPESNLSGTQQRLSQVLADINECTGCNWNGVVGKKPSETFMYNALTQDEGVFLYFGHGGGEGCFSRAQIESMIGSENDSKHGDCKSSVILMGCSSGILKSVNQRSGPQIHEARIYCEPEGVALSYLCAGAPCVVGNLWDVTDRDIDR